MEEKDEKAVENLNIESLDDLFDDIDDDKKGDKAKSENKIEEKSNKVENVSNSKNSDLEDMLDLNSSDDAPILPQDDDEDTYDLQKELEAKFDELFGPLEDDE